MDNPKQPTQYQISVERPAMLITLALNIILAVALAITVVLKVYMLVLTDLVCDPDLVSLGNLIRCQTMLELAAGFLATSAVVAIACGLLVARTDVWSRALGLLAAAAFASVMDTVVNGGQNWQLTFAMIALFGMTVLTLVAGNVLKRLSSGSSDQN